MSEAVPNSLIVSFFGIHYDGEKRRKDVMNDWNSQTSKLEDYFLRKFQEIIGNRNNEKTDVIKATEAVPTYDQYGKDIQDFKQEIDTFHCESEEYEGPHFTKFLRKLRKTCLTIQNKLDKLDYQGQNAVRQIRKEFLAQTEDIWTKAFSKAHEEKCDDCEVGFI